MDLRCVGKVLLRSAQYAPLTTVAQQTARRTILRTTADTLHYFPPTSRYFSTTRPALQQSAAAKKAEDDETSPPPPPREPEQRITMSTRHQRDTRSSPAKRKDPLAFMYSARQAPEPGAIPQQSSSPGSSPLIQTNRSVSDAFLEGNKNNPDLDFLQKRKKPGSPQRPAPKSSNSEGFTGTVRAITDLLDQFSSSSTPDHNKPRTAHKVNTDAMITGQPSRPEGYDFPKIPSKAMEAVPPTFRISPSLGRTVKVDPKLKVDVARAFRMVEMKCNANSVKQDLYKQRFHERPGIRRKRLVMSRWRRRFKEAFKATVRRVEDMRRKGW